MNIKTISGIEYELPKVFLLADNGIGQSEFAARTCYNSYDNSENDCIPYINEYLEKLDTEIIENQLREVESSKLLYDLSNVYFHHSVVEHSYLTFFIKGTSRGVLQELARHRMASYSVKSTRYTLDNVMYNFLLSMFHIEEDTSKKYFVENCLFLELFVTSNEDYNRLELEGIYKKLKYQFKTMEPREFLELIIPSSNVDDFLKCTNADDGLEILMRKKKRNVGDNFKHIITDNFKVDLTMTINLRSLKNFFDLRLSGAAWFQIRWLAEEIKNTTPDKYLDIITKKKAI